MDNLSKEQRHKSMSHIHSKDTTVEVNLRKALWHKGYRYRKNYSVLPGSPDIAITKYKIAIFCDSEFFHGKDWYEVLRPRVLRGNNPEFWENKIKSNMKRDAENNRALFDLGWTVIRFWGKEIIHNVDKCVSIVEDTALQIRVNSWNDAHPDDYDPE